MNRLIARTTTALALLSLVAGMAIAGPPAKDKKPAAAPTCPSCKMALSAKKSDKTPVAVYLKGKTYYCCSGCKMDKSLTTKPGKGHTTPKPGKGHKK
ncbi:MAG TPA: hypothetical protein VFB21_13180 [Chthonomonadaceae bacterium]|nr:hypothetical protein [Chthonomonadaceae bacterium]